MTQEVRRKALLIDIAQCAGCGECYEACKERNGLPATADDFLDDRLSSQTFTVLEQTEDRYVRHLCMHCEVPTCVSVCPVGAFEKTAAGPVVYHESRCIGCRYCMQACPFGVPRYEWDKTLPIVQKCHMCSDRVAEGRPTACTEACPFDATLFGDREEMIAEARRRIAESPDTYVDYIYGLDDIGGTSVLWISDVPFERLGFPTNLGNAPLPHLTQAVLEKIPAFSVFAGMFLSGTWWITKRREEVRRAEGKETGNDRR